FGGPLKTCLEACPNGINATATNSSLNISGYNLSSSANTNSMQLNIIMHETEPPVVTLISPENNHQFDAGTTQVTFKWNVTDNLNASMQCRIYTKGSYQQPVTCENATTCEQTISFTAGSYTWKVNCSDGWNYGVSETRSFKIASSGGGGGGGAGGGGAGGISGGGYCGDGFCNATYIEYNFMCSAYNYEELYNITLYGSWNGWHANETRSVNGQSANVTFTKTFYASGNYLWNCYVCGKSNGSVGCSFVGSNLSANIQVAGGNETQENCCIDCGCPVGYTCNVTINACVLSLACFCGDGLCDAACNETQENCPQDCFFSCGNNICEPLLGETAENCPQDCLRRPAQPCGDGFCDRATGENADTCPQDCKAVCGDKICEGNETQKNCCLDCGCPFGYECKRVEEKDEFGNVEIKYKCKLRRTWWWLIILVVIAITIYFTYKHYRKKTRKKLFRGLGGFK
ncbi:MAG: hypothetical protein QXE93_02370, partial [Candidatus Pacearchaeota archaeon]